MHTAHDCLCANTLIGLISVKHTSETYILLANNDFRLSASASVSSALTTGVTFADLDSSTTKPYAEIGLEQLTTIVRDYIKALKSYLDDVLPSYIIPTIWVVLKNIPLDPSGKLVAGSWMTGSLEWTSRHTTLLPILISFLFCGSQSPKQRDSFDTHALASSMYWPPTSTLHNRSWLIEVSPSQRYS